jgi:polyhydroxybutyrate depolymerase
VGASWNAGDCCGDAWTNSVDDVQFTKDLLALIEGQYCIDPKRIYATGFSNGGFMSHRLACEMADTFAAVAPVSGVLGIPPDKCNPSRAVPVLHFHGTADPIVPYNGGTPISPVNFGGPVTFRSVAETILIWRQKDDCLGAGDVIFQQGDATCLAYGPCAGGADLALCSIQNGGHTWPGGVPIPLGNTSTSISASDTMAAFFAAHPMP